MIIWLASYPRSGNTYFRVLLNSIFGVKTYSIHNDTHDIAADQATSEVVGHEHLPESFDLAHARLSDNIYVIKTHAPPQNETDKAIYLVRDGRESSVSYHKYLKNFYSSPLALYDVITGAAAFGTWGEHVNSWSPQTRPNTLLIKFEDLVSAPEEFYPRIANFIGIPASKQHAPSFKELQEINPKFFNSGKKDSWLNQISEEEQLAFWMTNHEQMKAMGYTDKTPSLLHSEYAPFFLALGRQINKQCQRANAAAQLRTQKLEQEKAKLLADLEVSRKKLDEMRRQQRETDAQLTKLNQSNSTMGRKIDSLMKIKRHVDLLAKQSALRTPRKAWHIYRQLIDISNTADHI